MVVEDIDTEEQHNVDQPPADGYLVRRQEEWRPRAVELCYVACHGHEEELHKREKDPFDKNQLVDITGTDLAHPPADGSKLYLC